MAFSDHGVGNNNKGPSSETSSTTSNHGFVPIYLATLTINPLDYSTKATAKSSTTGTSVSASSTSYGGTYFSNSTVRKSNKLAGNSNTWGSGLNQHTHTTNGVTMIQRSLFPTHHVNASDYLINSPNVHSILRSTVGTSSSIHSDTKTVHESVHDNVHDNDNYNSKQELFSKAAITTNHTTHHQLDLKQPRPNTNNNYNNHDHISNSDSNRTMMHHSKINPQPDTSSIVQPSIEKNYDTHLLTTSNTTTLPTPSVPQYRQKIHHRSSRPNDSLISHNKNRFSSSSLLLQQPKINPTAVSSYGTVVSSGFYSSRTTATTPDGFPYIPSIHYSNPIKKYGQSTMMHISGGGGGGSIGLSHGSGISSDITSSSLWDSDFESRFQNSYLLRSGRYNCAVTTNTTSNNHNSSGSTRHSMVQNKSTAMLPKRSRTQNNYLSSDLNIHFKQSIDDTFVETSNCFSSQSTSLHTNLQLFHHNPNHDNDDSNTDHHSRDYQLPSPRLDTTIGDKWLAPSAEDTPSPKSDNNDNRFHSLFSPTRRREDDYVQEEQTQESFPSIFNHVHTKSENLSSIEALPYFHENQIQLEYGTSEGTYSNQSQIVLTPKRQGGENSTSCTTDSDALPQSVFYWTPLRSSLNTSTSTSTTCLRPDPNNNVCTLNSHHHDGLSRGSSSIRSRTQSQGKSDHQQSPDNNENETEFSPVPLATWENCLYVRPEGARSGRLCITKTHLIFLYDDDTFHPKLPTDSGNYVYNANNNNSNSGGSIWNNRFGIPGSIDEFIENDGDLSRCPTPVNLELDESGEGGGFELIGDAQFGDMLESGFHDITSRIPHEELEKENLSEGCIDSSRETITTLSTRSNNSFPASSISVKEVKLKRNENIPEDCQPSSPLYFSSEDAGNNKMNDDEYTNTESFTEESYEEMMNKCIIRAIREEARRRLLELDEEEDIHAVSSVGSIECDINGYHDRSNNDLDVCAAQTYVSSFSEIDMEYDHDQERKMYITGRDKAIERKFVGIKWPLSALAEIYPRSYMMREVAFEIFACCSCSTPPNPSQTSSISSSYNTTKPTDEYDVPIGPLSSSSVFLVIPDNDNDIENETTSFPRLGRKKKRSRRDEFVESLKLHSPLLSLIYWQVSLQIQTPQKWGVVNFVQDAQRRTWTPTSIFKRHNYKQEPLYFLTHAWRKGDISNYDYLIRLNAISGRSVHDPSRYPVFPWVLSNYSSDSVPDLTDERNFRDLSKPMGALCPDRLKKFLCKYSSLCSCTDSAIPPFMYGSHYSSIGGVVLHYLVRSRPFAGLHRQLQGGQFDVPDRLFRSVEQTWEICSQTSATEVKELTLEWYSDPSFLRNDHGFSLGTSVDGAAISDVILPPWANNDPSKFIDVMRNALESDYCSSKLPLWIDLIFGCKQRGPEAEKSHNVFYHLTYYNSDDLSKIDDEALRRQIELHIADFGHCPNQIFSKSHPQKKTDAIISQSKGELQNYLQQDGPTVGSRKILMGTQTHSTP